MAKETEEKYIPPKFWSTCSNGDAKHPHKFGHDPREVKQYLTRVRADYEKHGKTFKGVFEMLDYAQKEVEDKGLSSKPST